MTTPRTGSEGNNLGTKRLTINEDCEELSKTIRRYVASRVPPDDVEDVAEDVIERLLQGDSTFSWPYVWQATRWVVADYHRKRKQDLPAQYEVVEGNDVLDVRLSLLDFSHNVALLTHRQRDALGAGNHGQHVNVRVLQSKARRRLQPLMATRLDGYMDTGIVRHGDRQQRYTVWYRGNVVLFTNDKEAGIRWLENHNVDCSRLYSARWNDEGSPTREAIQLS